MFPPPSEGVLTGESVLGSPPMVIGTFEELDLNGTPMALLSLKCEAISPLSFGSTLLGVG
jgi:hypothetical protein